MQLLISTPNFWTPEILSLICLVLSEVYLIIHEWNDYTRDKCGDKCGERYIFSFNARAQREMITRLGAIVTIYPITLR